MCPCLSAQYLLPERVTQAAEVKAGTTRAIYVVFDNSGSMYGPGNKAWSQAIYAMEVFAAMMNFDSGDQMKIFPMHDVTTDGSETFEDNIFYYSQVDF